MIDNLSILLSHALLAFALWHLVNRPDLDLEDAAVPDVEPEGFARQLISATRKKQVPPDA